MSASVTVQRLGSPGRAPGGTAPAPAPPALADLVKFGVLGAVLAMLADAAIGHALLWKNDPFWTYWVTDTFLITTIFVVGSAWLGVGVARGAVVTALQTVVLTTYYWMLSPIGLPSEPRWLDLEHTWVTGLPVHFGVYYLGYLTALWLWRRRRRIDVGAKDHTGVAVTRAAGVGLGVVIVTGALQTVLVGEFPGVTWFVMRTVVAAVFTIGWWTFAGRDRGAAVAGGITLALALMAYNHFLGPVGVPETDLRLLGQDSPPLDSHWLSYTDEWLVVFPATLLVAVIVFTLTARRGDQPLPTRRLAVPAVVVVALAGIAVGVGLEGGPDDHVATVSAAGAAHVGAGAAFDAPAQEASGRLRLVAQERNPRVTPLPPHDRVDLHAAVEHPDGERYEITATQAMIQDPLGRFTTWGGVGFDKWHHGRSGIATPTLPATRSDVVLFAIGEVQTGGRTIATNVPVHAAASGDGTVHLQVGDHESAVTGLPDGGLTARWTDGDVTTPERGQRWANLFGAAVLVTLLAAIAMALRADHDAPAPTILA